MLNIACVFPGQGSQTVGMLGELAAKYPIVLDVFTQASNILGYDLWELIKFGPEDKLSQTEYTQVALLAADVAVFRLFQQQHHMPIAMMAGHSLGEYAALVCAKAVEFSDAVALVSQRGRLMQQCVPAGVGAMAAIVGLSDHDVTLLCQDASVNNEQVTPANFNAIGQVVIAGHTAAVQRALGLAQARQARLVKLITVSVPCHCSLLLEAAEEFAEYLAQTNFRTPEITVISNVDLSYYSSAQHIKALLKAQLIQPVRWVGTIQLMTKNAMQMIIECGPGKVLNGLIRRIEKTIKVISIYDEASLQHTYNIGINNMDYHDKE